ncbi:methylenetetrahydrofolate reductase [NAD(P)H] [Nitrosomonas sp. HPC101]|uniref:methylenetetrahydrofolate reductase n=1 Tax=Nitrosomonas sp. HPC101 TaxID=1658667 RepID=UPI00136842C2|nr:methylenetetrahydrofolate reductase [Nitrosomonas sp. HPC101]MXS84454.1 methylenetetrahydrofolate reductase [NAD(P)H] [Nitrosomonas sp. HPC101]
MQFQKNFTPTFSFEFFPPQTLEGMEKLQATRIQLARFNPKFFSVTFGAGGSTRENIRSILEKYRSHGISHIIALRGDLPSGMAQAGEFRYANELVTFIREEFGDTFWIEVAAYPEYHPQARSALEDFANFKRKVEAGANAAITQFFYNVDAYLHFVEMCEAANLNVPIVPGIMPISKFSQLARFADGCGTEIPRWIRRKLESFGDDIPSIQAFGLDVVTTLCARLLEAGAPGLHFYTLNSAALTTRIWQRLGL